MSREIPEGDSGAVCEGQQVSAMGAAARHKTRAACRGQQEKGKGMQGECICELRGIEKRYRRGEEPRLGPLSLSLYRGEALGIRGKNGSGKSTLLNILAGTDRQTAGELLMQEELKGRISYVPQELSLYEELSGEENLRFWGLVKRMPERAIRARSRWLLRELGLEGKGRERVSAYSGGMKRRLHLATALLQLPGLLLLDEVTVGADVESAELILRLLLHVRNQGAGIVMVSHREGELERLCDRIICLRGGRISEGIPGESL